MCHRLKKKLPVELLFIFDIFLESNCSPEDYMALETVLSQDSCQKSNDSAMKIHGPGEKHTVFGLKHALHGEKYTVFRKVYG